MEATATTILTVDQVAEQLGCEPIVVRRLIARRRLAAARLGEKGAYRITAEAISNYISGGAHDFTPPKFVNNWFDPHETYSSVQFRKGFGQAAEAQRPSDDELRSAKEGTHARPELTRIVGGSGAVATHCQSPSPHDITRFENMGDVYIAGRLRAFAQTEASKVVKGTLVGGPLQRLYDSPEAFERIVDMATAKTVLDVIHWSETLVPQTGPNERPLPAVLVKYQFPLKNMPGNIGSRVLAVAKLAF